MKKSKMLDQMKVCQLFIRAWIALSLTVLEFPYSINNWPCTSNASKAALEELQTTHWLIPVPTYEFDSSLMHPQYYKSMLTNAIVKVNFTLTHWTISAKPGQGGENVDAYTPSFILCVF